MGQQNVLFFDEEEVIAFLRSRGYRVFKEEYPEGRFVSTIPQLVQFFYAKRRFYNPDRKFPESIDNANDRKYIGGYVQSRQKLGLDKKTAVKEVAQIIDALFKYEALLGLSTPVISPKILGVRYIMDRVCSYLNGEVAEAGEIDTEIAVQKYNDYYDRHFAEEDIEFAARRRDEILGSLED